MIDSEKLLEDNSLPKVSDYTRWKLLEDRIICFDKFVDDRIFKFERLILMWNMEDAKANIPPEKRKPIKLVMMNYGGNADFMWSFVDVVKLSKTPVYTYNMGLCASAASIIFITGHKRFMMPGATILFHEGNGAFEGEATKVIDDVEAYKDMVKKMNDYIVERTGISKQVMSRKKNNNWIIDSKFCIENKVCDKIIESLDDILM